MSNWQSAAERILLTVWVGGLLSVGYLVAPVLFASLDDRQLAGEIAGQLFSAMSVIGLIAGGLLLISVLTHMKSAWVRTWRVWVLICMLILVFVGGFIIQPMMAELKLQGITPIS